MEEGRKPNLQQEVKGNPRKNDISEVFTDSKGSIHHPVCQPLCVIIFLLRVNGFATAIACHDRKEKKDGCVWCVCVCLTN